MVRPAAPWFRWGLVLWGVAFLVGLTSLPYVNEAVGVAGTVALSVGVYRLVQHADRAAGYEPPRPRDGSDAARDEALSRQSAARAALAAAAEVRPAADDGR